MTTNDQDLTLVANTIRMLSADAVEKAKSGHPGMPMGMADVASVLWLEHLRYDPKDPTWPGRDRFVLSAGHGSMLLYSLLHLAGFDLPMEELKRFRQLGSLTPGHPENILTPGVEVTTGPLGQGFGNGVGIALAAKMMGARFSRELFESRVFGIVSDGDLMEGISAEASSIAGHLRLDNLIYLYDDNSITIEGKTSLAFSEDVKLRFEAVGWSVERIDGHDLGQIRSVLSRVSERRARPTLVICKTHIAHGAPNKHDSHDAHGSPLGPEEVAATRKNLGWNLEPFAVPDRVRVLFGKKAEEMHEVHVRWNQNLQSWIKDNKEKAETLNAMWERKTPPFLLQELLPAAGTEADATRNHSGKIIQKAAALVPAMAGGSADLDPSTKTKIKESTSIKAGDYTGRVLHFGIREHAMGAILNGMALHGGFIPFGSTFLVFSDYMRPSIRLAALSEVQAVFVFTHDSILLGEDGPTHQPVEHLSALRLIPRIRVIRPADGPETAAAWTMALTRRDGPTALVLTRQKTAALERPEDFDPEEMLKGGYVLKDADDGHPDLVLVATGAEVGVAVEAAGILERKGKKVRVVSALCLEVLKEDPGYRDLILARGFARIVAVEMGRPELWREWVGDSGFVIGVDSFGASAPDKALAEEFGFTGPNVAARIEGFLARR